MLFRDVNPFVRYARHLKLDKTWTPNQVVPLDARLFYAVDGCGKIEVNGTRYEMAPHALLLINSGVPYQILPPKTAAHYVAINFDYTQKASARTLPIKPEPPQQFDSSMLTDPTDFEDTQALGSVIYLQNAVSLQNSLHEIVAEYTRQLVYFRQKCGHLLSACLADALRLAEMGSGSHENDVAAHILAYVHKNYALPLSNQSVGKAFGYHPNYVGNLTRRATGMPMHRYVLHVRLTHAATLLENGSLSVGEIAAACGFCDAAYFSAYFKKRFGVAPSKYRGV